MESTIDRAVRDAAARARRTGRPVLASVVVPLAGGQPGDVWAAAAFGAFAEPPRLVMAGPHGGPALVGYGVAWHLEADGPGRFAAIQETFRRLAASALRVEASAAQGPAPATGLVAAGAFRFDPLRPADPSWGELPDAAFVVPRLLLTWAAPEGPLHLTVNVAVGPDADPVQVAAAVAADARALVRSVQAAPPIDVGLDGGSARAARAGDALRGKSGGRRRPDADGADEAAARRWQARVALAVEAIRRGAFAKVVLARSQELNTPGRLDFARLVQALAGQSPASARFILSLEGPHGQGWWVGATPERLVACRAGTELRTMALAGSAPRGTTAREDTALGDALMASPKQRAEHRWVVEAVREALAPLVASLEVPDAPGLMKLPYVQHLCTPITARLSPGRSLIDVVAALHPTPAVGGHPREAALEWLRFHEELDRGWYAAPVGWWDAAGNGEFWVAIRSARLWVGDGGGPVRATLYAGCGIVADSDPHDEWVESALKLRAMRRLLAQAGLLGKVEAEEVASRRAAV